MNLRIPTTTDRKSQLGWNLMTAPLRLNKDSECPFAYESTAADVKFPINRGQKVIGSLFDPFFLLKSHYVYPPVLTCPWVGNSHTLWLSRMQPDDDEEWVSFAVYRQWGWNAVMLRIWERA